MNRQDLTELLNALPDEWIDSAAEPEIPQKRTHFRLWVTGIAACLAVLIAAAVYPKLRVQVPGRIETTAVTSETTALQSSALTTVSETSQVTQTGTPAVTALPVTSESAVTETGTVSAETARIATTYTTAEPVTQTADSSGSAESSVTAQRTTAPAESTGTKTGTSAETVFSTSTQLSSETFKPPGTTANAADTTANCNTQTEITTPCGNTTLAFTTTVAFATTTVNTNAMAAQTFCPSCWVWDLPRPEVTQPELTSPAQTPVSETVAVSVTVYTETLPELHYCDEQPEIDFTQYNAVLITAKLPYDEMLLETGVISGSELSLYFLRKSDAKPAKDYERQYLIALPKEYQISSVTGQVTRALSLQQYLYALERPFTIFY